MLQPLTLIKMGHHVGIRKKRVTFARMCLQHQKLYQNILKLFIIVLNRLFVMFVVINRHGNQHGRFVNGSSMAERDNN